MALSKNMSRYLIIGYSGSGKSTLSRTLSNLTSIPYFDSDSLYWDTDWKLLSGDEVVAQLPLDDESWILDGNFVTHREQVWSRATEIIWLDPPFLKGMFRLVKRNMGWWLSRKPSWGGSRMPLKVALSGIAHGWRRRKKNKSDFAQFISEYPSKSIYHIRSNPEYVSFLSSKESLR